MIKVNCKVMFDNGGGIHVDFNGYKHFYGDGRNAARDYLQFIQDGNTEGWEGHEDDVAIEEGKCSNGGYKTIDHETIQEMVKNNPDHFFGYNEEEFITAIENLSV